MQGWQQAIDSLWELKASALTKVPEFGPLFGHAEEKEQAKRATDSSGPMETEAAGNNWLGTSQLDVVGACWGPCFEIKQFFVAENRWRSTTMVDRELSWLWRGEGQVARMLRKQVQMAKGSGRRQSLGLPAIRESSKQPSGKEGRIVNRASDGTNRQPISGKRRLAQ